MTRKPQAVRSANDAVRKANDALDILVEIDDVLREAADARMAPVFERVLTNNQPSGVVYGPFEWALAPQKLRVAGLVMWARRVLYGDPGPMYWPTVYAPTHVDECFEPCAGPGEWLEGDCCSPYEHHLGDAHQRLSCTPDRIHDELTHYGSATTPLVRMLWMNVVHYRTRWDPCPWLASECVGIDGEEHTDYGSWLYRLNFVREDLRDLYA